MVEEGLLAAYDEMATGKLVTPRHRKNALGMNVGGYVMPMFHSQIAIAYNPELVKSRRRPTPSSSRGAKPTPASSATTASRAG